MTDPHPKTLLQNERKILNLVRVNGAMQRAALAGETGLTQPWVHRMTDQLLARGLLVAGAPPKGGRGQPSITLALRPQAAYAVGVALGTDSVDVCLADLACQVTAQRRIDSVALDRDATLRALAPMIDGMLEEHGVARADVIGVGLSIPAFFIAGGRQVNAPEPLRAWSLVDLEPVVSAALGLPVTIQNNATAAAIGENLLGVGRWARSFCYLDFGYGFGSGVILDGKPYTGRHGNAGEITFSVPGVNPASRPALRYLLESLQALSVPVATIAQLRQSFDPAWPGVAEWMEGVKPALDQIVNVLAGLFDPDAIVFGGELPPALGRALIDNASFWDREHRYGVAPPRPRLVLAEGGQHTQALGAALVPLWAHFYTEE